MADAEPRPLTDAQLAAREARWTAAPVPTPGDDPGAQDDVGVGAPVLDARPTIRITPAMDRVVREAAAALDGDPTVFQRSGRLVRVAQARPPKVAWLAGSTGLPSIEEWTREPLRQRLSVRADWVHYDARRKGWEPALPPGWAADCLLGAASPTSPLLDSVVPAPTLRPDGSVLSAPGYDASTALYLAPHGLQLDIPDKPDIGHARDALDSLDALLADFPFESPTHRSAMLAAILTACVRSAIQGPCPLTLISGNAPGTGKSLLADVVSTIALGRPAPRMAVSAEDDEMRKRITTIAVTGLRLVLLDNVDSRVKGGALGGSALDAVLTCEEWQDRMLGGNRMATLPMRTLWLATGNNVAIRGDLLRRVVPVRLLSPVERPEERTGFRIPRLLDTVRRERARLLGAAITAVRAWFLAGRPPQPLPPLGSFEAWSDVVRSAIVWAGYIDPCIGRANLREQADPELAGVAELLSTWRAAFPLDALTAAQVCLRADGDLRDALVEVAGRNGQPSSRSLGLLLRSYRDRVVCGLVIRSVGGSSHHGLSWRVVPV